MEKPKSPCRKDCELRSAHCHNETCPHGWAEYERQVAEFVAYVEKQQDHYYATRPLTAARKNLGHRNAMKRKRNGKF